MIFDIFLDRWLSRYGWGTRIFGTKAFENRLPRLLNWNHLFSWLNTFFTFVERFGCLYLSGWLVRRGRKGGNLSLGFFFFFFFCFGTHPRSKKKKKKKKKNSKK